MTDFGDPSGFILKRAMVTGDRSNRGVVVGLRLSGVALGKMVRR